MEILKALAYLCASGNDQSERAGGDESVQQRRAKEGGEILLKATLTYLMTTPPVTKKKNLIIYIKLIPLTTRVKLAYQTTISSRVKTALVHPKTMHQLGSRVEEADFKVIANKEPFVKQAATPA